MSKLFNEWDELELDLNIGLVRNLTTGQSIQGRPYPSRILEILAAGGMIPLIVAKAGAKTR